MTESKGADETPKEWPRFCSIQFRFSYAAPIKSCPKVLYTSYNIVFWRKPQQSNEPLWASTRQWWQGKNISMLMTFSCMSFNPHQLDRLFNLDLCLALQLPWPKLEQNWGQDHSASRFTFWNQSDSFLGFLLHVKSLFISASYQMHCCAQCSITCSESAVPPTKLKTRR